MITNLLIKHRGMMAKAKNHTNNIDSVTLGSIEVNSAFMKRFVTDYPIFEVRWYVRQS